MNMKDSQSDYLGAQQPQEGIDSKQEDMLCLFFSA